MHAPRMHTMVSVHSTGPRDVARASSPCCPRPGWPCHEHGPLDSQRTKPESYSSRSACENMSVPGAWDPDYAAAYALAERFVGWLMRWGKRTKPEYVGKQMACKNMSSAGVPVSRNPNRRHGATALGKVFRASRTAFVPRKTHPQLPLFQTKPECKRREGAYQNMSKTLG